jgi:hypothetical protein
MSEVNEETKWFEDFRRQKLMINNSLFQLPEMNPEWSWRIANDVKKNDLRGGCLKMLTGGRWQSFLSVERRQEGKTFKDVTDKGEGEGDGE